VSNVLNEQTKQQVIALGRLGWSLRRIQKTTGVRRETAAAYLREAGVTVRPSGLWGHRSANPAANEAVAELLPTTASGAGAGPPSAKPAIEVEATTDFGAESETPAGSCGAPPDADLTTGAAPADAATAVGADSAHAKPAIEVTTDFGVAPAAEAAAAPSSASTCAVHRDAIELGLSRGRNAMAIWQDLVDIRGFTGGYQSVKRFVRKLVGGPSKEACAVIETAAGEDYGKSRVMVRGACIPWRFGRTTAIYPTRSFHNLPTARILGLSDFTSLRSLRCSQTGFLVTSAGSIARHRTSSAWTKLEVVCWNCATRMT